MPTITIKTDDLRGAQTIALLEAHRRGMVDYSPRRKCAYAESDDRAILCETVRCRSHCFSTKGFTMKTYTQIAACLTWALVTVPALAQTTAPAAGAPAPIDHSAHMAMSAPADATVGSTAEYQQANASMHKGMDIPFTGNADTDFVAGMIPHHQGAIDMARVELKYGNFNNVIATFT